MKNIIYLLFAFLLISCGGGLGGEQMTESESYNITAEELKQFSQKAIFLGHKSVGGNILDGIAEIAEENGVSIEIVETTDAANVHAGVIAHMEIGENEKPYVKLNEFTEAVGSGIGSNADVASMKFCYIDFSSAFDTEALFNAYKASINNMKTQYPDTTFIHFTTPLTSLQTGPKAWVKKILGRDIRGVEDNVSRYSYNRMIREEYGADGLVFDLARLESTAPDGSRITGSKNGITYEIMYDGYTYDGGHLNSLGRKRIASEFVKFINGLD